MQGFFLSSGGTRASQRFCVHHEPRLRDGRALGALLYVHPFGEEMNKSRRMAALQSRALARAGFAVLQQDLFGCGDSAGNLDEATWADWVADVLNGARWLRERYDAPLWLWGLRAGCLLAAEAAAALPEPCQFLFWQPSANGKSLLQQFLRLKLASQMLDGRSSEVMEALRTALHRGESVEVAGYRLPSAIAQGMERAWLHPPAGATKAIWLECSAQEEPRVLPATDAAAKAWRGAGHAVDMAVVRGPAFWQTQEIEDAPELIHATLSSLEQVLESA